VKQVVRDGRGRAPIFAQYEIGTISRARRPAAMAHGSAHVGSKVSSACGASSRRGLRATLRAGLRRYRSHAREPPQAGVDPFAHADAQRRFRVLDDQERLRRALEFRGEVVVLSFTRLSGAWWATLCGSGQRSTWRCGTGKSVVAMHVRPPRARRRGNPVFYDVLETLARDSSKPSGTCCLAKDAARDSVLTFGTSTAWQWKRWNARGGRPSWQARPKDVLRALRGRPRTGWRQ